jgi:hypothetical protein
METTRCIVRTVITTANWFLMNTWVSIVVAKVQLLKQSAEGIQGLMAVKNVLRYVTGVKPNVNAKHLNLPGKSEGQY